jgi:pilus assembly protein Flp/PilA
MKGILDMKGSFMKFLSDESGTTGIEYGMIASGIALAIMGVVGGLGINLNTAFASSAISDVTHCAVVQIVKVQTSWSRPSPAGIVISGIVI